MTRKIIISLLIICINTSLAFATPRDIQFHWAGTEINTLIENEIMIGYEDGRFKPSRLITKEEYEYWIDKYTLENIYNVRKHAIVVQ